MKLYFHPASPNCAVVSMTAAILDTPLEMQLVNLFAGDQGKPEFLRLNPNGKVPVLADGDIVLWESCAIAQYIASKKPNSLWPDNALARHDIARWQFWSHIHWIQAMRPYIFENIFKQLRGAGEPDQEVIKKAGDDFHKYAAVLDNHLAGHAYLVGKELTLADLTAASYLAYQESSGLPIESYKHIARWFAAIESLPTWLKTQEHVPGFMKKVA